MFKLIFRTVITTLFLIFLTVALAIWKGGGPFRYFGEGVTVVGKSIMEFGDFVDEFKSGSKKLRRSYDKLKDAVRTEDREVKDGKEK